MDNIQIAKKIKQLCKSKNMTVKTLLDDCNIGRGFIYNLEKRQQIPLADKLELIADYLDVSVDYLLGRTDEPQSIYVTSTISKQDLRDFARKPQGKYLSEEEAEIIGVYRLLDVRNRTRLLSFVLELEDDLQKMQ